ncbi:hypothetical protein PAXINDRAFT_181632 [Paxillus involutus ATCC 200175]|uniref:Uncharacterized protein n=1 Tax=Paxillus involutus ATCC 200175 TaxID=664439 RepID=A0A0C9TY13_PAXIN|nr:hypothetical protein PAXINDRAFT_181632 [Paxillus involutus ATCC 200175]
MYPWIAESMFTTCGQFLRSYTVKESNRRNFLVLQMPLRDMFSSEECLEHAKVSQSSISQGLARDAVK